MGREAKIGIIGAGASGLAAAWELSRRGIDSVVMEKSRSVSGRAATRSHGACRYDHGANYFKLEDPRVADLIHNQLPTDELVAIPGDVFVFDAEGTIHAGDRSANAVTKWTYRRGISTLGKLLEAGASQARVVRSTRIAKIEHRGGAWTCIDDDGRVWGPFDQLLITLPAPQAAELLATSSIASGLCLPLAECAYHCQFTFVLGYHRRIMPDRAYHALVNLDRRHPLAWLSFEDDKPGHVADGESIAIAQMSANWSIGHFDQDRTRLLEEALGEVETLLGQALGAPDWSDSQRWRFAHPVGPVDPQVLDRASALSLDFAGDALVGRGRVSEALRTGLDAAGRLAER